MTNEELHKAFVYEPETGRLRKLNGRVPYPWRAIGKGYLGTSYGLDTYYAHRLVWQYHHGVVPKALDHIDGDPKNNRIENLRECTPGQNQHNSRRKSNNRSGYKGVAFCTGYVKPWRARIVVDGKVVELGYYTTPEEAAMAYAQGAVRLAKEFARVDLPGEI